MNLENTTRLNQCLQNNLIRRTCLVKCIVEAELVAVPKGLLRPLARYGSVVALRYLGSGCITTKVSATVYTDADNA